MANYSSKDVAFLLVGGFSLLGQTTALSETIAATLQEMTALGDEWAEHVDTAIRRATLTQSGYFDDVTNSAHESMVKVTAGGSRVVCYGVEGNVIGRKFMGFVGALQSKYERIVSLNAIHRANASYNGSGRVYEGVILQEHATRGDDWNTAVEGTSVDNGAASSNGGAAFIQVSGFSGPNTLTVKVRHAADGGGSGATWADLATFTVTGSQVGSVVAVSGTVNRYLSVLATGFGNVSASASASPSISPSVSASASASPSRSPSSSVSPSASQSRSPSASLSPSASTSLSPSVSASASASPSLSPSTSVSPSASLSPSASASPSAGAGPASSVTLMVGFARS